MTFHLADDIFDIVKNGTKHIEVRLNDKKRQGLEVGENLTFLCVSNEDKKIDAIIKNIEYFKTIEDLVDTYGIGDMYLENCSKDDFIKVVKRFYTEEEIEKYGLVAIDFEKREKSCGIMVFKDDSVLLVHQNVGHWSLPKGHVEKNETEHETAIRETKEETNIDAKILGDFRYVVSYSPKLNTMKDVVFFIGEPLTDNLKPQEIEASEVLYVDIFRAKELLKEDMLDMLNEGYKEYQKIKKIN